MIYIDTANTFFTGSSNKQIASFFGAGMSKGEVVAGYNKIIQAVDETNVKLDHRVMLVLEQHI